MSNKVFIENHLENYLKSLAKRQLYIPGVIVGQVINDNYYVVHLSAVTVWSDETKNNVIDVLAYKTLTDLLANSDTIFQKLLEVVNLLPGGSHVLGLFFVVPQDAKSIQPVNIDFYEFNKQLIENLVCNKNNQTWNYLLLNYSTVNKKSFCYTVDFNRSSGPEKTTYKSIDDTFGSFDNDWITLIGTFNFGALDQLNIAGGRNALFSIRDNLLDQFESVLNKSVFTFNGYVYEENKMLKDIECVSVGELLKNVVNIELYREVDLGNECKNASLQVERGKGKVLMSGLCSLAVPIHRNGTIKDAIKAIREDALQTFAIRLKMHLESLVEEELTEEEDGDIDVLHETPRRILILKTEGSRFAFSDYIFPGEPSQESLYVVGEILNLPDEKMAIYDMLEKGRHSYYETLSTDIDANPPQSDSVISNNKILLYFALIVVILAIIMVYLVNVTEL